LVPYFSFSFFHCVGYLRDILLPALLAGVSIPAGIRAATLNMANAAQRHQPKTLHVATYWEVLLTPIYILLQVITFRQSILSPVIYFQFLSVRYVTSASTRSAFHRIRTVCDARLVPMAAQAGIGGTLARVYTRSRDWLIQFSEKRLRQPTAAPRAAN
jgi:hypothetical protein